MDKLTINLNSEIGRLKGVIVHTPGAEVENMTPENTERALYSDILNLRIALSEYTDFLSVLKKYTRVFEVKTLLLESLKQEDAKQHLLERLCKQELKNHSPETCEMLQNISAEKLASFLIEGVPMQKDNLTRFLDNERYSIPPLPNFFFTRDACFSVHDQVMISKMANQVRAREAVIMETIFHAHPAFQARVMNPVALYDNTGKGTIEGGDVLVARENILVVGTGGRSSTQGIDSLIQYLKTKPGIKHLLVQELPLKPESFIHLDMTFTFLDKDQCMIYEPLILGSNKYLTIHIIIDGNKVTKIREEKNLIHSLKALGMDLKPVYCGGKNDLYIQEREQWQSGANFLALEPGKVIGYERNVRTIEDMNKQGFEVVTARDVAEGKVSLDNDKKMVITIKGNELSRGGGGARCMSMPVSREEISW